MKKRNFIQSAATFTLLVTLTVAAIGNPSFPLCEVIMENDIVATFNAPSLSFNSVWAEHNVNSEGRKGMLIHIDIDITGMRGKDCQAVAYFHDENGHPLYNQGGGYRTTDGKVATGKNFSPDYDICHSRLTMFMPYGELHLNGTYTLKYRVVVTGNGEKIGNNSNWETFRLSWRTNVPESDCPKCGC